MHLLYNEQSEKNSGFGSLIPCFGHEVKRGKERNFVIFNDNLSIIILIESSRRGLFIYDCLKFYL